MEELDPKTDGATTDIVGRNIEKLKELFPDVFTEGKVDFDALRETLSDYVEDSQERYSFTWNGKSRARRIAQTPSTCTLRPCPEESVNWDTTQNLFIEGDNLEVLKLLQKSYHKRVKMIYIDPPYNTGKKFIYSDRFQDNLDTYLRYTGQIDDEGFKMSANAETSGRYHTNWLNMMYPRLKLARNLLRDDGVIFISIDDNEVSNLRKICDEIFGEENFIESLIWKRKATPPNDRIIGKNHEYILAYAKQENALSLHLQPREKRVTDRYTNPDNDPNGPWVASDLSANGKGGRLVESCLFPISNPETGTDHYPPKNKCWLYNEDKVESMLGTGRIAFRKSTGTPFLKRYLNEVRQGATLPTIIDNAGFSQNSAKEIRLLFSGDVFEFPKPSALMKKLAICGLGSQDTLLDFFSGSCTTAHAVLDLNREDGGNRKFIMVQLPESCDEKSEAYKSGYKNIAEIGKERIRRVIEKLEAEQEGKARETEEKLSGTAEKIPELHLGFKVFKLDASNIKPWDADFDNIETALIDAVENIKPDRSETDVLYELLLKYGLDLAVPIEERAISGTTVYIIGAGALIVCLAKEIDLNVVEGIAVLKEELNPEVMRVVFRDAGFKDDVVKTNAVQILRQAGIEDVKSL